MRNSNCLRSRNVVDDHLCHSVLQMDHVVRLLDHHHRRLCLTYSGDMARRNRSQNVVSGVGHFVSWATEVVILNAIGAVLHASGEGANVSLAKCVFILSVPSMNYAIFPTVQARKIDIRTQEGQSPEIMGNNSISGDGHVYMERQLVIGRFVKFSGRSIN